MLELTWHLISKKMENSIFNFIGLHDDILYWSPKRKYEFVNQPFFTNGSGIFPPIYIFFAIFIPLTEPGFVYYFTFLHIDLHHIPFYVLLHTSQNFLQSFRVIRYYRHVICKHQCIYFRLSNYRSSLIFLSPFVL